MKIFPRRKNQVKKNLFLTLMLGFFFLNAINLNDCKAETDSKPLFKDASIKSNADWNSAKEQGN